MNNYDQVHEDLVALTELGITLLMDDFGTGHSSIDRLSQLPFASLKLDQGVVRRMGTSPRNLNVVKSAISMARELRMTSVAEGVESEGAYNFLIANGCEEAQGYFIGKPMALADFTDFVRQPHDFAGSQIGRIHQALYNIIYYRKCLIDAAFCSNLGTSDVLQSVIDPDISHTSESSRFGAWYYQMGQGLAHLEHFQSLEEPLHELHSGGSLFMQQLQAGADGARLDKIILDIDQNVDQLVSLLHALERELLLNLDR